MNELDLSIIIPTYNEETNIEDCLKSALGLAKEIFVVDSFSKDKTLEIAQKYANKVVQHEYINSATQKNWAIPQAKYPWVMILDADERITPELIGEIRSILNPDTKYNGFRIRRENTFFGKPMKYCGWGNDSVLRLFKRDISKYKDKAVHADVECPAPIGVLRHPLSHNSYRSMEQYIEKFQRYTTWSADDLAKRNIKVSCFHLALKPIGRFLRMYIFNLGFLAGIRGLVLAMLGMFSVFMKYAKLWERQRK